MPYNVRGLFFFGLAADSCASKKVGGRMAGENTRRCFENTSICVRAVCPFLRILGGEETSK